MVNLGCLIVNICQINCLFHPCQYAVVMLAMSSARSGHAVVHRTVHLYVWSSPVFLVVILISLIYLYLTPPGCLRSDCLTQIVMHWLLGQRALTNFKYISCIDSWDNKLNSSRLWMGWGGLCIKRHIFIKPKYS